MKRATTWTILSLVVGAIVTRSAPAQDIYGAISAGNCAVESFAVRPMISANDGGGIGKGGGATLLVDGERVAQGHIDRTVFGRFSIDETFDLGEDTGTPVIPDYRIPAKFTGTLHKVVIEFTPVQLTTWDQAQLKTSDQVLGQSQ